MLRIQSEIDKLDNINHKTLINDKNESGLKNECKKLRNIFDSILKDEDKENESLNNMNLTLDKLPQILNDVLDKIGVDSSILSKLHKDPNKFMKNLKDLLGSNINILDEDNIKLEMKGKNITEIKEFSLGRKRKAKGDHPVLKFIEEFKKAVEDPKFTCKSNQPLKSILKSICQYFDDKLESDPIHKYSITE